MLATMVEHVIGIDPDRDRVTAAVVDTATTGEQATAVRTTGLCWCGPDQHITGVGGRGHRQLWCRRDHLSRRPR